MQKLLYVVIMAVLLVLQPAPARADDVIKIRLSIKLIRDANGSLPSGVVPARVESLILSTLNDLAASHWRGYRFEYAGPITEIGGPGDPNGPSQWYDAEINFCPGIRNDALADQSAYAWNPNAINVYITNAPGQHRATTCPVTLTCPLGLQSNMIIVVERGTAEQATDYFHEIGHYFGLSHTQGCDCNACARDSQGNPVNTGVCFTEPGDDQIADTLADAACWNGDQIAQYHFGTSFNTLNPANQEQVLDVVQNIMSYRTLRTRLTEEQLDVWADAANGIQSNTVDGRTILLDPNGSGSGNGSSTNPYDTVPNALAATNPSGGDILLFRPGRYPERVTINGPVTLRATRAGPAVIGLPLPPPPGGVTCPPANAPRKTKCCEVLPNRMCRSVTDCIDPTATTGGCP